MIYYFDKNKKLNEIVKKKITYTPGTDIEFVNNLDGTVTINNIATSITIDNTLSDTSQNAVENRVIKSKLDSLDLSIQTNKTAILSVKTDLETHINQGEIHVTNEEKQIISKFGQSNDGKLTFDGIEYGSGSNITVDDTLSSTSTNPVQNKIITNKITNLESTVNAIPKVTYSLNGSVLTITTS